ncbi:hypothetical protein [Scytonema sp. NUACC26]|uniref:hypothetical protein n=1 Tax=Scytonema sp. NUACC26 TaxID=3140176 RepID=UPI0034DBEC67
MRLVTPYHYRIYECCGSRWFVFDAARVFYKLEECDMALAVKLRLSHFQFLGKGCDRVRQGSFEVPLRSGWMPLANTVDKTTLAVLDNLQDLRLETVQTLRTNWRRQKK